MGTYATNIRKTVDKCIVPMTDNEGLQKIRNEIDRIDSELIPLFVERMRCSEKVAEIKRSEGIAVLDKDREKKVLEKVRGNAGEYGDAASVLYAAMMSISRARQHQLLDTGKTVREMESSAPRKLDLDGKRILCQGTDGAYSHKATLQFMEQNGSGNIGFKGTWKEVFDSVNVGNADFGVLPVENSSAGSVYDVYSMILKYRLHIVGVAAVKISHCLASVESGTIKRVISHPQALAQCSSYISEKGFTAEEFSNTAMAAKYVKEKNDPDLAAICSEDAAAEFGLRILEKDIQDMSYNTTRFVLLSKTPILPDDANKIGLCFSLPHTSGSLYSILERFAINGLNLTKIESRPIPGSNFDYQFYLDFTGNVHDQGTLNLIRILSDELPEFSFLGNYREI
jgi:Prephenate dehydratase